MLSQMRVPRRVSRLALLVAVVVAAPCLGGLAEAAMPAGSSPDCPGGQCAEQIGCRQPVPSHLPNGSTAPRAAILPATDLNLGLSPSGLVAIAPGIGALPSHRAAPFVSRSPPTA